MAKENKIKHELLKQMDQETLETSDVNINSAAQIIEKHKRHLKRLKWIAAMSWVFVGLFALVMHYVKISLLNSNAGAESLLTADQFWLLRYSDTALIVFIIAAVLPTYLVYSQSKNLAMFQICARLASIEQYLKKISQEK